MTPSPYFCDRAPHARSRHADGDGARYFTMDVFDTVVTRAVPRPQDLFLVLGQRLQATSALSASGFAGARVDAEASLRRRLTDGDDVNLAEIYAELGRLRGIHDRRVLAGWQDAEIALELEFARPWEPGLEVLRVWRARATFLGFLSDTYLPAEVVQRMLERVAAWQAGDRLFVSNEMEATKASGLLFKRLQADQGFPSADWIHFGDNAQADILAPQHAGLVGSAIVRTPILQRAQRACEQTSKADLSRPLRLTAALGHAAVSVAPEDEHLRRVRVIGAEILAPTLTWFVHDVLKRARDARLDTLWFLARDGQIVHDAATLVNHHVGFTGEMHYVLASRQALHLAALEAFDAETRRWVMENPTIATPHDIADRLGFHGDARQELLAAIRRFTPDGPIRHHAAEVWSLIASTPFRDQSMAVAAEQRDLARRYYGSISSWDRLGIVDLGWGANLQCSLSTILERSDITGYYLGLLSRNPAVDVSHTHPCLFDYSREDVWLWSRGMSVMELLFAATHAGLVRFAPAPAGGAVGVLADPSSWQAQMAWGIPVLQDAALRGVANLVREGIIPTAQEVRRLLGGLLSQPSHLEAQTLASWPTQNLQNRTVGTPLIDCPSWLELLRRAASGIAPQCSHWDAGFRAIHGPAAYLGYRAVSRLARLRHGC